MINLIFVSILMIFIFVASLSGRRFTWMAPIALGVVYLISQPIPHLMGHPVHERYVSGQEAMILGGLANVLMVIFKGDQEPRLVWVSSFEEAQEALRESKKKATFVVFGKEFGPSGGDGSDVDSSSSLRILGDGEQTMITKNDPDGISSGF